MESNADSVASDNITTTVSTARVVNPPVGTTRL